MSNSSFPLNALEVQVCLQSVEGWTVVNNHLQHVFSLPSFPSAIFFVNAIAHCAERAIHHPDITIAYDRVTISISTHSAGGITDKDFALAQDIDKLWQVFKTEPIS